MAYQNVVTAGSDEDFLKVKEIRGWHNSQNGDISRTTILND